MDRKLAVFSIGVLTVVVLGAGCGRQAEPTASDRDGEQAAPSAQSAAPQREAVAKLIEELDAMVLAGETNAAIARLQQALGNPAYADFRGELFLRLTDQLLKSGTTAEVDAMMKQELADNEPLAFRVAAMRHQALSEQEDFAAIESWTAGLMREEVSPRFRLNVTAWHLRSLLLQDKDEALVEGIVRARNEVGDTDAARLLHYLFNTALSSERSAAIDRMLAAVEAMPDRGTDLDSFLANARLRLLERKGDWDAVTEFVMARSSDPKVFANLIGGVLQSAKRAGALDAVEKIARGVLDSSPQDAAIMRQAAQEWVGVAAQRGQHAELVSRLANLRERGVPAQDVSQILHRHFYDVIESDRQEVAERLLELGKTLEAEVGDVTTKRTLQALLLDGGVIRGDYALALSVLKGGFRSDETEWHTMAVDKIGAHLALEEERYEDAIQGFRSFMDHTAQYEEGTMDPITGILHTREMMLGRNAKRIGDMYLKIGKPDDARAAFAEARAYYQQALADEKTDEKAEALIRSELAEIPGMPAGEEGAAEK